MTSIPGGRVQDDDTGPIVIHRICPAAAEEPHAESDQDEPVRTHEGPRRTVAGGIASTGVRCLGSAIES
jgi:hypothetical protein